MKDYKFLFKPLFYIFNILFATCLVVKIEKLHPSDLGKNRSLFETDHTSVTKTIHPRPFSASDKLFLKNLFLDYKTGKINNAQLDKQLDEFFKPEKYITTGAKK